MPALLEHDQGPGLRRDWQDVHSPVEVIVVQDRKSSFNQVRGAEDGSTNSRWKPCRDEGLADPVQQAENQTATENVAPTASVVQRHDEPSANMYRSRLTNV